MKTQSAKAKGRRLQQTVVSHILDNSKGLTEDDVVSRAMGSPGSDVMLSQAALLQWPFDIECKNLGTGFTKIYDALEQSNARNDKMPLMVLKQNKKNPAVALYLTDFVALIRRLNEN